MDAESIFFKCTFFTIEALVSYLFYQQYRKHARCLKSLKEAQLLELDGELKKTVEKNNGVIKYAVISGKIQALSSPLVSQYVPYLSGVIREKITTERKVKWNPFLGIWGSANNEILQSVNSVPFAICSKSGNLFKKTVAVEISEPLTAKELVVPTIYDEFTYHNDSFGDAVFGVIRGEKLLGIQEIERMLCENEKLTAVGKLILENNKLHMKPPDEDLTYFLTPLSLESLTNKVKFTAKVYKVTTIIMSTLTFALLLYLSRQGYSEIKKRVIRSRERKKLEEERKLRRKEASKLQTPDDSIPKCIVCLDKNVEVILLECGHACLCFDCSEQIQNMCPICRNSIARIVPAFWP